MRKYFFSSQDKQYCFNYIPEQIQLLPNFSISVKRRLIIKTTVTWPWEDVTIEVLRRLDVAAEPAAGHV